MKSALSKGMSKTASYRRIYIKQTYFHFSEPKFVIINGLLLICKAFNKSTYIKP